MSQTTEIVDGTLTLKIMSILDDTRQDRIEAYLLGELPEKERKAFEEEMNRDEALNRAVVEMKELQADLMALEKDEFMGRLNAIREELESNPSEPLGKEDPTGASPEKEGAPKEDSAGASPEKEGAPKEDSKVASPEKEGKVRAFPRWYLAAAAVILLLIVPFYFILRPNPTLMEQYFEPYENLYSSRGSSDAEIRQALAQYDKGEFKESIVHFDAYLEAVPSDSEAVFYAGIAHLAAGETGDAIALLGSVQTEGFIYRQRARWYLALSYIQAGNTAAAESLLEELSGLETDLGEKAIELLKEIR